MALESFIFAKLSSAVSAGDHIARLTDEPKSCIVSDGRADFCILQAPIRRKS